jgi:hypothetical protein
MTFPPVLTFSVSAPRPRCRTGDRIVDSRRWRPTSEASGRSRSSAARTGERNMTAGRQPGRCPNVGGALRAAIEREAGARCPHATSWLCGSYRTVGSVGTRSTSRQEPLVLSRGDFEATRFAVRKSPSLAVHSPCSMVPGPRQTRPRGGVMFQTSPKGILPPPEHFL